MVEVARPLGSARLVPVRYVTESAKVSMLVPLPLTAAAVEDALAFLERYRALAPANTDLHMVSARSRGFQNIAVQLG